MSKVPMKSFLMGACAVAALSFGVATASAQTYGYATVGPGMSQTLSGVSGGGGYGQLDGGMYGSSCWGWIAAAPDHMLTVTSATTVNIAATASDSGDTTLIVTGPGGTFCNDDSNGFNPGVSAMLQPGTYSVFVGSYGQGTTHPYSISFTGMGGGMPVGQGAYGLNSTSMTPTDPMGPVYLTPGFLPDPVVRTGTATGTVAMGSIPNNYGGTCRGYAQGNPNHIMVLNSPFSYLRMVAQSQGDPTLVVQDPNGTYWCNDDFNGLQPGVEGPWAAGTWRIWVGTYSSGQVTPYTLSFTEYQY